MEIYNHKYMYMHILTYSVSIFIYFSVSFLFSNISLHVNLYRSKLFFLNDIDIAKVIQPINFEKND